MDDQNYTTMNNEAEIKKIEHAFDTVMDAIEEKWMFDDRRYPQLPKREHERTDFIIKHVILRMLNSIANIAQYPEARDKKHVSGNYSHLQNGVKSQMVNSFRIARQLGITGKDIVRYLQEKV